MSRPNVSYTLRKYILWQSEFMLWGTFVCVFTSGCVDVYGCAKQKRFRTRSTTTYRTCRPYPRRTYFSEPSGAFQDDQCALGHPRLDPYVYQMELPEWHWNLRLIQTSRWPLPCAFRPPESLPASTWSSILEVIRFIHIKTTTYTTRRSLSFTIPFKGTKLYTFPFLCTWSLLLAISNELPSDINALISFT